MPHDSNRKHPATRRDFLKNAALTGAAGFWVGGRGAWAQAGPATRASTSPSEKLNLGIIGVGGRATGNLDEEDKAVASENIVAICDVDVTRLGKVGERFPKAQRYADFRKLIERSDLDAVVITTPDHTHAAATLMALNSGKHVYCEKPLTHTVEEARRVAEAAARNKRITQMGTQIHAGNNYRRVVELIQGGAIGAVGEVHVWVGANWSANKSPTPVAEIPAHLDFDLWQGPNLPRPFAKEYHPEDWRRWWAFGNGTLGDMGCHYLDLPFWALKLRHPTTIRAQGPAVHPEGCPAGLTVDYAFPARGELPPVKLTWYDAGKRPPMAGEWGVPPTAGSGVVFVGERGKLFADYNQKKLLPAGDFADFKAPAKSISASIGHHREWLEAIRRDAGPDATTCHFDSAGALTEAVLLGTVAFRAGREIEWDAKAMKVTNVREANQFLRTEYRKGWDM